MSNACQFCGNPDATQVADTFICDACYIARGSCCAEWFEDTDPSGDSPPPAPADDAQDSKA